MRRSWITLWVSDVDCHTQRVRQVFTLLVVDKVTLQRRSVGHRIYAGITDLYYAIKLNQDRALDKRLACLEYTTDNDGCGWIATTGCNCKRLQAIFRSNLEGSNDRQLAGVRCTTIR